MNKLFAAFKVYKKGQSVSNPESWKNGQITGSILAGFLGALVALAKAYGYELPVSDEQLVTIGAGIVAVVGLFLNPTATVVSSDKVGVSTSDQATKQPSIPGH